MKRWLLAGLGAVATATAVPAQQPGYMVIRVVLESSGGNGAAGDPGPGGPGGPGGEGEGLPGQGPGGPGGGRGGGRPGLGGIGGVGGPPGGGGGQPSINQKNAVVAVVPYTAIYNRPLYPPGGGGGTPNQNMTAIKTKYGSTCLYKDNTSIQLYDLPGTSYETQVKVAHEKWKRNQSKFDDAYNLIISALQFGMAEEAYGYAKELANAVQVNKDKPVPANITTFVNTFKSLSTQIDTPPTKPTGADKWKERLGLASVTESTHYALIHGREVDAEDINRRLVMLEQNYKAFFLWHSVLGKALKLPESKLIVVLVDRASEMDRFKSGLDGRQVESDAFFSPSHGIVVLSPERLDDSGRTFLKQVQTQYAQGWSRKNLVKGIAPKSVGKDPNEIARVMMLALVDVTIEEEADRAAISREGSRQLYAATGVLPQNVLLPEWVEQGAASFFERPKGPYLTSSSSQNMTVGLAPGYGSTNFVLIKQYWDLMRSNRLNSDPAELLLFTITDKYFDAARSGNDPDPAPQRAAGGPGGAPAGPGGGGRPGPPGGGRGRPGEIGEGGGQPPPPPGSEGPMEDPNQPIDEVSDGRNRKQAMEQKAHATSWALTYFLARTRIEGLHKFYQELANMPRDLRLDPKTVTMTFARCFNLLDATGQNIDQKAMTDLANEWVAHMKTAPTTGRNLNLTNTGGPGGLPGGGPGGPGGPGGGRGAPGGPGGGPGGPGGGRG